MRGNVARKCLLNSSRRAYATQCQHRQRIADQNSVVNAFVSVSEQPRKSSGPLADLKVAVKDNITTSKLPTTCSSAMLQDFVSPFDATVVDLLQSSGADIIGKTNCDEFGMGSLNVHSVHGPVVNPFKLSNAIGSSESRSAGGSSGGSAAAVAAGMCDAALGTDTGGSVRLPASYCGVVGLKPSYGLISRWGVVSYADSLDCVGILAKDIKTTKRLFDSIARYDDKDPTAAPTDIRKLAAIHTTSTMSSSVLEGLRVGIPQEYFPAEISTEILEHTRGVIKRLKEAGATIVPLSLPTTSYALSSYYVLASAEASSNLARYDGVQYGSYVKPDPSTDKTKTSNIYAQTRSVNFGPEVQKRILLGTYALSADAFDNYFLQAQRVRERIKGDFNRVFKILNYFSDATTTLSSVESGRVDVLLHPSAIRTAPLLSEGRSGAADLSSYVQDVLTVPASLAGLPALSVPVRRASPEEWPIGISVVGQWGSDELVLAVGEAIEKL